jgi:ankyrin repeat protein
MNEKELRIAIINGDEKLARSLVEQGTNVNSHDNFGGTPLSIAIKHGHENLAKWLIEQGADINAPNHKGWTPLMFAIKAENENLAKWLIEHHADCNAHMTEGSSALSLAVRRDFVTLVEMLLNHGADVHIAGDKGRSLLSAAKHRDPRIETLLRQRGAEYKVAGYTDEELQEISNLISLGETVLCKVCNLPIKNTPTATYCETGCTSIHTTYRSPAMSKILNDIGESP